MKLFPLPPLAGSYIFATRADTFVQFRGENLKMLLCSLHCGILYLVEEV